MKYSSSNKILYIILGALLFTVFLTSCENFLKGGGVANEIKDTISYNNAKIVKVNLYSNEEMGIITPDSTYDAHLGFDFKLQFIPNTKKYVITNPDNVFEAVSLKDSSVSRADCVKFTPIEQTAADKKAGIYYSYVKVIKAADDIRIIPKCTVIPEITSTYPPNDNTSYPQDSLVKIYFNKPVKLSDFAEPDGSLKNISIKAGARDLLNSEAPCFKSPYLEDDGKTLVLPIANGNYIFADSSGTTETIEVIVSLEGLTDGAENENVPFVQTEYKFKYRVDPRKDSTPPVFKTLRVARTEDDARNGTNLISMDTFAHYATKVNYEDNADIVTENVFNHRVNKVWIYFETEDADSGIEKLVIDEKLVFNKDAVLENGELFSNVYKNAAALEVYTNCFEYCFSTPGDGVVNLAFNLYDYSGNVNKKEIELIKDTSCIETASILVKKPENGYYYIDENGNATCKIEVIPKAYSFDNYCIKDLDGKIYYDSLSYEDENERPVKISKMEYGSSKEQLTTLSFEGLEFEISQQSLGRQGYYKKYTPELTINATKDLLVYLTIEDYLGNAIIQESIIPACVNVVNWYEKTVKIGTEDKPKWYFQTDTTKQYKLLYVFEDTSGIKSEIKEMILLNTIPVPGAKIVGKIKVLSVAPLFAETIRRVNCCESISILFS